MRKYILFIAIQLFVLGLAAQNTMPTAVNIGTQSATFSYSNTLNTANYTNDYVGRPSNDVFYKFTLTKTMCVSIAHCGSDVSDTYLHLLDASGNLIESNDDYEEYDENDELMGCPNYYHSYLERLLLAGTYYVVSEGYSQNGNITTSISGEIATPGQLPFTDAGTYGASFSYSDTKNTTNAQNYYAGQTTKDVLYKFTLTQAMEVVLSHCGSYLDDTYLHLLDASGNLIDENDDYYNDAVVCAEDRQSYLTNQLPIGTYYVVSEGYSQNGNILTTITGHRPSVSAVPDAGQNYIKTRTYTSDDQQHFLETIQYYDGLGRPIETVQSQLSPSGKDIVSRTEYDAFGRAFKNWLPAPNNKTDGSYNGSTAGVSFYNDTHPYSEIQYEASPLNRVNEQYGPGQVWRSNSRKVKTEYMTNSTLSTQPQLICKKFIWEEPSRFRKEGNYAAQQLYVTKTTGEDNNVAYEFKDKLGRVILQRQINGNETTADGRLDTYYIYDDFGNLVYVLPPLASDALTSDAHYEMYGTYANTALQDYAYVYSYDERNRMSGRKLAEKDVENLVYDKADRLSMHQTANISLNNGRGWIFYKYDALGRMILTGIYHGEDNSTNDSNMRAYLMTNYYKDNNILSVESPSSSGAYNYTWNVFPSAADAEVTQANYYDNYTYATGGKPQLNYVAKTGYGTQHPSAQGLLTGTRVKLLDTNKEIVTAYYYDYKGNLIQKRATNQLGGYDYEYYAYNFTNQVTQKQIEHNVAGQDLVREEYTYNYDHAGRLQTVLYSYGGRPVNIANYAYDEAGRMKQKKTGVGLETTNYLYNVRNWVTSQTGSRFSENLYYTNNPKSGGLSYFGGNISALTWNASPNMTVQGYSFQYDNLGQLKHAVYGANSMLGININRYNESFTYDKHGNIQTLQRYGLKDNNSFGLIDDLTMTHQGNLLTEVEDAVGDQSSSDLMEFKNRFYFGWGGEYGYNNGNMTWDYNKEICQIRYNYLSLPKSVQFRHGNRIEYVYDAAGMRRTTIHKESDMDLNFDWWSLDTLPNSHVLLQTKTDYIANKVYVNGQLSKILTEEGYVEKENGSLNAYYYLKDHLGNNRMVMNSAGTIVQTNNFYPSGTSMANYPRQTWQGVQPYKYNGKELDRSNGLDFYNYEARSFDPVLMRFTSVDPLAGKYYSISPFVYCANNPIRYTDPTGMYIESAWDVFSLGLGVKSFVDNVRAGNVGAAILDGVGVVADAAAVALPIIPGGVGAAIKGVRAVDKAVDAVSVGNKVGKATDAAKIGKYGDVPNPKHVGEGKATTSTQRKNILNENRKQNNGELRSDGDGRVLNQPKKTVKGQKADMNQAEVDHINPKSKGGSNDNSNLQVLSKDENLKKGNR